MPSKQGFQRHEGREEFDEFSEATRGTRVNQSGFEPSREPSRGRSHEGSRERGRQGSREPSRDESYERTRSNDRERRRKTGRESGHERGRDERCERSRDRCQDRQRENNPLQHNYEQFGKDKWGHQQHLDRRDRSESPGSRAKDGIRLSRPLEGQTTADRTRKGVWRALVKDRANNSRAQE